MVGTKKEKEEIVKLKFLTETSKYKKNKEYSLTLVRAKKYLMNKYAIII